MLKQSDVIVTRNSVNGSYECAALVNGTRVSKVYYFYTKREAIRRFTRETNAEHERQGCGQIGCTAYKGNDDA